MTTGRPTHSPYPPVCETYALPCDAANCCHQPTHPGHLCSPVLFLHPGKLSTRSVIVHRPGTILSNRATFCYPFPCPGAYVLSTLDMVHLSSNTYTSLCFQKKYIDIMTLHNRTIAIERFYYSRI